VSGSVTQLEIRGCCGICLLDGGASEFDKVCLKNKTDCICWQFCFLKYYVDLSCNSSLMD